MTADRNQAGYTDASGAHGAGLVVMWVRRGRPGLLRARGDRKNLHDGRNDDDPRDDIDVWVGLDVGKSAHHAHALDHDGNTLYDKPLKQDEKAIRTMLGKLSKHGRVLLVVDQPNTIGSLP